MNGKSFESRLESIERRSDFGIPGTILSRVLMPDCDGIGWCLSVGAMSFPKVHFYGKTIGDAVSEAEAWLDKRGTK